jgi:hypothetical protein
MPGTFPLFDGSVQLKLVAPSCVVCFSLSRPWTSGGMAGFRTQLVRLFRCLTPGAYGGMARQPHIRVGAGRFVARTIGWWRLRAGKK